MAYTKQTWNTGDIITADKLNHIEDGIENNNPGVMVVILTLTEGTPEGAFTVTSNIKVKEIYDALNNGKMVRAYFSYPDSLYEKQELNITLWHYYEDDDSYLVNMDTGYNIFDETDYYSVYLTVFTLQNLTGGQGVDTIIMDDISHQIAKRTEA